MITNEELELLNYDYKSVFDKMIENYRIVKSASATCYKIQVKYKDKETLEQWKDYDYYEYNDLEIAKTRLLYIVSREVDKMLPWLEVENNSRGL